ncbi:MAG: hypothetical protein HY795_16275 [Desulfovibrio sp.]|nr:hypothetical protein [Desulfovibrio sp.]MBI4959193.1 hypothetical protein [Desulfovibrio sp.]
MNFQFLGAFLLEQGIITQQQIDEATAFQAETNHRLGTYALEAGLLTQQQVNIVLGLQRETDLSFGELAVLNGFVPKRDLDSLLFRQRVNQIHLGEALLMLGHLSSEQFSDMLGRYIARENRRRAKLARLYSHRCDCDLLDVLITSIERAFLRFAHCPLKAQGELSANELEGLTLGFSSGIFIEEDAMLRFTLHLGPDMLSIISRAAAGEDLPEAETVEAAREIVDVVCRYLRKAVDASSTVIEPCARALSDNTPDEECLRLKLACPRAAIGLTVCLVTGQPEIASLC